MLQLDGIWILEMLQSDGIFGVAVLIVWRKGLSELSAKHAGTSSADVSYTLQHIVTGCWSQTFEGPSVSMPTFWMHWKILEASSQRRFLARRSQRPLPISGKVKESRCLTQAVTAMWNPSKMQDFESSQLHINDYKWSRYIIPPTHVQKQMTIFISPSVPKTKREYIPT